MYLNFSNKKYKNIALNTRLVNYINKNTSYDAFLLLLNDVDYDVIDTLCIEVAKKLSNIDSKKVYELIQKRYIDSSFKYIVLTTAYEIIHLNRPLGTKTNIDKRNKKHIASAWITHCLFEGEVASSFANAMGLDVDTARKLGILHDIGRKQDQSFNHTIKGFEYLIDKGYKDEAFCALTHSFLSSPNYGTYKGNRCANCDPSLEGFYIDKKGNGVFKEGSTLDDITNFLENYEYNPYDIILNISDLMATSKGITSPYNRMIDVYSRRDPDIKNSPFFKVCFINSLNNILYTITHDEQYNIYYNVKMLNSDKEIDDILMKVSNDFIEIYNDRISYNNVGDKYGR